MEWFEEKKSVSKVVNPKKPLRLENNTNYFNPAISKTHNTFGSAASYQSRKIKIEGYESRLYWQFRYCEDNNGQTFFYTLTYNDAHLPTYMGQPCFDYEDLREFLIGGFQKQLLRKFGTKFKYFIGAELGDGKGKRGMHNNPHYHIIFFLEDAKNPRFPYRKILPEQFRHLVRMYWQGFDEAEGKVDYRDAKFGIAREGDNLGFVTDFRACMYCAKYVSKDAKLKMHEDKVRRYFENKFKKEIKDDEVYYRQFFHEVIYPKYNIPLDAKHTKWQYNDEELIHHLLGDDYELLVLPWCDESDEDRIFYSDAVQSIITIKNLYNEYCDFVRSQTLDKAREAVNEYRNRYCNKARISHGVGDYALEFIDDLLNPSVQVPSKKGFKNRPLPLYLYRKLYMDTVKDKYGSNLYVLNSLGKEYKLAKLPERLKKKEQQAESNLNIIVNNRKLYEKMVESDINTEVSFSFNEFLDELDYLYNENNKEEIIKRYAEYKIIYEDRLFKINTIGDYSVGSMPVISPVADYERFLSPSYFTISRNDIRVHTYVESHYEDWLDYYAHPYFLRFVRVFAVLDMCADYFFVQGDDKAQAEAEERASTKRFHDREKVREFYRSFGIE